MLRKIKFIMTILVLIGSLSLSSLMAEAAHPVQDMSIEYGVATEVEADDETGEDEDTNGTHGDDDYDEEEADFDLEEYPNGPPNTKAGYGAEDEEDENGTDDETEKDEVEEDEDENETDDETEKEEVEVDEDENGTDDVTEEDEADSVDKDALLAKLIESDPKELDEASYTEASWKALQAAWKKAIDVFDYDATQDEVNEALAALTKAYNGLTDAVDKQESDKPFVEDDICSEDSTEMQMTINLDEETNVCANQTIDIAETMNQIVMPQDLPANTTLTVIDVAESDIVTEAKGLYRGGDVLKFILKTPEGSQYTENFKLKMIYANGVSVDDIFYYNEETEEWDEQGAEFDYDDFTLNVELSHLSTYGVFEIVEEVQEEKDEPSKKEVIKDEDDDSNIKEESSKEDNSSEIAVSGEDDKDKDGSFLPSTATGIFNWVLIGVVILIIGITIFILNRRKSSKQK